MQRLPIILLVTALKYEQTAKDYRRLRKAFNMKDWDLKKKKDKKPIGGRLVGRSTFPKITNIFREIKDIELNQQEQDALKMFTEQEQ